MEDTLSPTDISSSLSEFVRKERILKVVSCFNMCFSLYLECLLRDKDGKSYM